MEFHFKYMQIHFRLTLKQGFQYGSTFLFHRLSIVCVPVQGRNSNISDFPDYISTVHARYMFWNYIDNTELVINIYVKYYIYMNYQGGYYEKIYS